MRQARSVPALTELNPWLSETLAQVSATSPMALAIGYSPSQWTALTNYAGDGQIDAQCDRAWPRGIAIGRNNYLHVGSDAVGHTAAVLYTLLGTFKLTRSTRSATGATSSSAPSSTVIGTLTVQGRIEVF